MKPRETKKLRDDDDTETCQGEELGFIYRPDKFQDVFPDHFHEVDDDSAIMKNELVLVPGSGEKGIKIAELGGKIMKKNRREAKTRPRGRGATRKMTEPQPTTRTTNPWATSP
mmetsp:Transcript_36642/g.78118  ORF Transcript_36642/g.78118 Transcript_36642/m.78118 type:complete len:113 (+) Transcript_36642:282-620(+)